jgi:hypothetical protein
MATTVSKLYSTGILQTAVELDEVTPAAGTTTGSAQFGGSNYLSVPNNVALNPGTGNFTIEFWIYLNSATANASLYRGQSGGVDIFMNGSSKLSFGQAGISTLIVDTANMTTGAWVHIAAVKNGGSITLYKNGAVVGSTGSAPNFVTTTITYIGSNGTWYVNGKITNLRVVIGSAVYTGAFTPPTSPLTAISGTQLLLLEDSNANLLKDSSTNNFTVTNNGTVTWSATSPSFASSTAVRVSTTGVYATLFDEVSLSAGTAERRTSTGTYMVSGYFDEYTALPGQQEFTTAGTYTWIAPVGVTSVSVVAIGPGAANAGGGGGLTWANGLSVTPGASYTVVVGAGGYVGYGSTNSNCSSFNGTACVALGGNSGGGAGGGGGLSQYALGASTFGGGYGGRWGGGAGGYTGNGGVGYGDNNTTNAGSSGSGGGGGGGGNQAFPNNGGGGGTGLYGIGSNGTYPGGGGSGGNSSSAGGTASLSGSYGGGGVYGGAGGASGAVRIIWGTGRSFPSTNVGNV